MELDERFWSKVNRTNDPTQCWEWTGYRNQDGYGGIFVNRRRVYAHRLSAQAAGMEIEGKVVRHSCDNPACVNPAHLLIGTHADNIRDRDIRGRGRWPGRKGSLNSTAKLNETIVANIKNAHVAAPRHPSGRVRPGCLKAIAERFSIPYGTMKNIVDGRQWKHVEGGVS